MDVSNALVCWILVHLPNTDFAEGTSNMSNYLISVTYAVRLAPYIRVLPPPTTD